MKKILFILCVIAFITNNCGQATRKQTKNNEVVCEQEENYGNKKISSNFDIEKEFNITDFTIISEKANFSRSHLIDSIIPDKYYYYWECVIDDYKYRKVYVYNGDSLQFAEKTKKITSNIGFFRECDPGVCFHYIVAVDSLKNIVLINSNEKFINFIGKIDNLSEVLLIGRLNNLYISNKEKIGGAYKEKEDYYLLYLTEWEYCPYRAFSVRAILQKTGEFLMIDKKMYEENLNKCSII
jgi:hypothetical protein